jgi:hypothetical protein
LSEQTNGRDHRPGCTSTQNGSLPNTLIKSVPSCKGHRSTRTVRPTWVGHLKVSPVTLLSNMVVSLWTLSPESLFFVSKLSEHIWSPLRDSKDGSLTTMIADTLSYINIIRSCCLNTTLQGLHSSVTSRELPRRQEYSPERLPLQRRMGSLASVISFPTTWNKKSY